MPLARTIVFYVFLLAYLIWCPRTILYVLGYDLRPGAARGLVKTGLLSVATRPPGASIYVEGRRYLKQTPAVLEGLYPGTYRVHITLTHHHPWVRTVRIDAGKATVAEKILLLPTRPVARVVVPGPIREIIPLPETRFLVLATGPTLDDLLVHDRGTASTWPLLPQGSPFGGAQVLSHTVVRGSPFLLLRVRSQDGESTLGASLKSGHAQVADLTRLFPVAPQWVTWDPHWPHQLLSVQDGSVNRLDLQAMAIHPNLVGQIRGLGVSHQTLYVLTEDLMLQRADQDGRPLDAPLDDPFATAALSRARGLFRITVLSEACVVLVGRRGELWASRAQDLVIDAGIRGFEFDPHREQLLFWRRDRLGVLDCSAEAREDDRVVAPRPRPRWIIEERRDIRQGVWVYDASHVVFQDGDEAFLLEREPPGAAAPRSLARVRAGSAVAYVEESGELYYLDRSTGALSVLEIR